MGGWGEFESALPIYTQALRLEPKWRRIVDEVVCMVYMYICGMYYIYIGTCLEVYIYIGPDIYGYTWGRGEPWGPRALFELTALALFYRCLPGVYPFGMGGGEAPP